MELNRRKFLMDTTSAATVLAAAPLLVPTRAFGANDRPTFGAIGVGSRGRWLNHTFQKLGAQCVAVCDVYEPILKRALGFAEGRQGLREPQGPAGAQGPRLRHDRHAGPPALPHAARRARRRQGRLPREAALAPSNRARRWSRPCARPTASCRSACSGAACRSCARPSRLIDDGALGRISMVKADVELELRRPARQRPAPRRARLGPLPGRCAAAVPSSPSTSAGGATSGTTPAAT